MKLLTSFTAVCLCASWFGLSAQSEAADTTPPELRFTYPTHGMLLVTNWPSIRGVVVDEPGGSGVESVTISIMAPDGTFWTGSGYGPEAVPLSTVITDGTNWSRSTGIPIKADLQVGDYVIFADAYDLAGNNIGISVTVTMNVPPPPVNDDFDDAELIVGTDGSVHSTTAGATREPGEPLHASVEGNASVWYKWVAPEPGFLTVHTLGSTIDTIMAVYTGDSVSNLSLQDGNDDGGELGSSRVETSVAEDITYYIAIDGKFGFSGSIVLNWEFSSLARPRLRVRLTNSPSAGIVVSWPSASTGFTLESSTSLQPGSWAPVSEPASIEDGQQVVVVPFGSQPHRLFRLQKPATP